MSYKQAMAYHATQTDARYAQSAFGIINGWVATNKAWGLTSENGPLEGGWGIAAMARSLEVLRSLPGFATTRTNFMSWFNTYVYPQMNSLVTNAANAYAAPGGTSKNIYNNCERVWGVPQKGARPPLVSGIAIARRPPHRQWL